MRALHTGGALAEPRRCHGGIGCSAAVRRRHFAGQRRHHGALQVTPEEGVEIRRGVWWRTHRTPEAGRTQNGASAPALDETRLSSYVYMVGYYYCYQRTGVRFETAVLGREVQDKIHSARAARPLVANVCRGGVSRTTLLVSAAGDASHRRASNSSRAAPACLPARPAVFVLLCSGTTAMRTVKGSLARCNGG